MLIVFHYMDALYEAAAGEGQTVTFGGENADVKVPGMNHGLVEVTGKSAHVQVHCRGIAGNNTDSGKYLYPISVSEASLCFVIVCRNEDKGRNVLELPPTCSIAVGRVKDRDHPNDLIINIPFVSRSHMKLQRTNGRLRVKDQGSVIGTYLNGRKITEKNVENGDVISISTVKLRYENSRLYIDNAGNRCTMPVLAADKKVVFEEQTDQNYLRYRRSPRTQNRLPQDEIILANPPMKQPDFDGRNPSIVPTILGSGAMLAASVFTGMASPALLAARAAGLIFPISGALSARARTKEQKQKLEAYEALRKQKYGAYIEEQEERIAAVAIAQRDIRTEENPDPSTCLRLIDGLDRSLWERTPEDEDFLSLRVGMGYEKLCVPVKSRAEVNGVQMEDDELRKLAEHIVEATSIVDQVPSRVSLREHESIGVIGNRPDVIKLVKNMILELVCTHSPEDVRIIGIFDEAEREKWESLRWLPHIWDPEKQLRFLAFRAEDADIVCSYFSDVLQERRARLKESHGDEICAPHYVFLFGSRKILEAQPLKNELFSGDRRMGITSLFLFDELCDLPYRCGYIVDLCDTPCAYDKKAINERQIFTMDEGITREEYDHIARKMSAIRLESSRASAGIPNGISFLQGYGVRRVEELNAFERWRSNQGSQSLAAPIGIGNGGRCLSLDIDETGHGPHGLVAGTTGSGKSELLQTWILSVALNYHPYDVSFVIIDYKGGGMANLLEPLPHVVGKITNLGENIYRMLDSLKSETRRRQMIFDDYGVSKYPQYQKLFYKGIAREPLPRLIIVADEFAELKREEPEFISTLISVARIGRSLGVHLILATQKPAGVVSDEIWSNSRFRICLKVQDISDSREMLKKPDAARITQPGRAYLMVGMDEVYELFQSYWSGAPYVPEQNGNLAGNPVKIITDNGQRVRTSRKEHQRHAESDELTAVVNYLRKTAKQHNIEKLRGLWRPPLPERIDFMTILEPASFCTGGWKGNKSSLRIPVGIFDSPEQQKQGPMYMDFFETGHYAVYGVRSADRTELLKTMISSLAAHYTPEEVNIYAIDFSSWGLTDFEKYPHVGGVVLSAEEEKLQTLLKMLQEELARRRKTFRSHSAASFQIYRESVDSHIPAIVLAVDNITDLVQEYPESEKLLINIGSFGATFGIYMVFTANSPSAVKYKIQSSVTGGIAFELADRADYTEAVGALEGRSLPKIQGRAFYKAQYPIMFQMASYADGATEKERKKNFAATAEKMKKQWKGPRVKGIPVMPEMVTSQDLEQVYSVKNQIPLGVRYDTLEPGFADLSRNYCLLISGGMHSGKSQLLAAVASMVHRANPRDKLYVIDSAAGGLSSLQRAAACYRVDKDPKGLRTMMLEMEELLNQRAKTLRKARGEKDGGLAAKQLLAASPQICLLIDDLNELNEHCGEENSTSVVRICSVAQDLGVLVFAAARTGDLEKLAQLETMTRAIVSWKNGLVISGAATDYLCFPNNLQGRDKTQKLAEGDALLFTEGNCIKIRRIMP